MSPDPQTDRVVKMFWQSFPDRKAASRVLAAISLICNKIGPIHTIDLTRKLAKTIEKNKASVISSVDHPDFSACFLATASETEQTEVELLETLMDHLVVELRDKKRHATKVGV